MISYQEETKWLDHTGSEVKVGDIVQRINYQGTPIAPPFMVEELKRIEGMNVEYGVLIGEGQEARSTFVRMIRVL